MTLALLQVTHLTQSSSLLLPFPGHQHGKRPLEEAKICFPSSTADFSDHPSSAAAARSLQRGRQSFWDLWNAVHRDNCIWLSFHLKDSFCYQSCKGLLTSVELYVYCHTHTCIRAKRHHEASSQLAGSQYDNEKALLFGAICTRQGALSALYQQSLWFTRSSQQQRYSNMQFHSTGSTSSTVFEDYPKKKKKVLWNS